MPQPFLPDFVEIMGIPLHHNWQTLLAVAQPTIVINIALSLPSLKLMTATSARRGPLGWGVAAYSRDDRRLLRRFHFSTPHSPAPRFPIDSRNGIETHPTVAVHLKQPDSMLSRLWN